MKITIVGLGLMGGSLGLALKKKIPEAEVYGVDCCPEVVCQAEKMGAVNLGTVDLGEGVRSADVIFLATPVSVMPGLCLQMTPFLKAGAIVTDLGSTKEQLVASLEEILPAEVSFLGGHPMAGSEKGGITEASADLLENAAYLLTPTAKTKGEVIDTVSAILARLGARIILLSPREHDRKVAAVSHLPHVLASALVNTVGFLEEEEGGYFLLAAGGFRDTTRIAGSQSQMWSEILLQNKKALLPLLQKLHQVLAEYEEALGKEDRVYLQELLEKARQRRQKVPTGLKGILPRIFEFTVMVPDEPGVLAGITGVLKEHGLNINDLEIQRVREENEGTIRLGFVKQETCRKAEKVLENYGYMVRKFRI